MNRKLKLDLRFYDHSYHVTVTKESFTVIFLRRHLLSCLHEQEKRSLGLTGSSSAPRDHRIKRKDFEDDPMAAEAETGSVKPSCSSSALDAISEAPEDEDMISQVQLFDTLEYHMPQNQLALIALSDFTIRNPRLKCQTMLNE